MTMATDYNNRLITPDLEKAMKDYPLYSQDRCSLHRSVFHRQRTLVHS